VGNQNIFFYAKTLVFNSVSFVVTTKTEIQFLKLLQ